MRRKNWTLTPWFIIFAAAMFFMAVAVYKYSATLCYIEMGASAVAFIIVFLMSFRFGRYIRSTVRSASEKLNAVNIDYLEDFKYPVSLVGKKGDIICCNALFKRSLCNGRSPEGDNINSYLSGRDIDYMLTGEGNDVFVNGREYTVFCTNTGAGVLCQYIDNTRYKQIAREYLASKPCTAIIVFDNAEDFFDNTDETYSQVTITVEAFLQKWASEYNALYKKIGNNRYMAVFRDSDIQKMISEKFPILREIRSITVERHSATVSIGISRGSDNLRLSELNARKALEMALGRGGDQVALIKKDNTYEFFGGKAEASEKLSKVRMRVIANSISRAVADCDKIFIMGHKYSDLDCVGASVGMQCILEKSFRRYCKIVTDKNTSMAKPLIDYVNEKSDTNIFITPEEAISGVTPKTLLIIVDTHLVRSVESAELYEKCKKIIVIDHHRKAVDYINNSLVFCHEPSASSASEMCSEIISYLDDKPLDYFHADALLAGITLDTKNFSIKTGVRTFEAAAYLKRRGANTLTVKEMFASSIDTYREKSEIVCRARIYKGCAVSIAKRVSGDIRLASAQAADEMLNLRGVKASFVLFGDPNNEDQVNISARSYGKMNVQTIMEQLGGGGHQTMAAAQIKNITKELAYQQLMAVIDSVLDDISNS